MRRVKSFPKSIKGSPSREPVFANDKSLYVGIDLMRIDPSGEIIEIIPSNMLWTPRCGGTASQDYIYSFSENAPCFGFLVQMVTVCCKFARCKGNCCDVNIDEVPFKSYWEIWRVNRGFANPISELNYTDRFEFTPQLLICGYYYQSTEARLYCDKDDKRNQIEHRDKGIVNPGWRGPVNIVISGGCKASSGGLNGSASEPSFWTKTPAKVWNRGSRTATLSWTCCPKNQHAEVSSWSTRS